MSNDQTLKQYEKYVNEIIAEKELPIFTKFNEISHSLKYYKPIKAYHTYHNGQRKLFLSELEFISLYHKKCNYIVYAGAAPSWKMYYLSSLFPTKKFILVDPNPFEILFYKDKSHKDFVDSKEVIYLDLSKPNTWIETITKPEKTRIFLINDYYTNAISEVLKVLKDILFISDIRTSDNDEAPSDLDVLWNSAQQMNWIYIIQPNYFMLKFRTPYLSQGKTVMLPYQKTDFDFSKQLGFDFIKEYNEGKGQFTYLDGEIYLQAWAGYKSTETRLIGSLPKNNQLTKKTYGIIEYEERLFYFNTICRMYGYYFNNYASKTIGYDHCYDCARENEIWLKYNMLVTPINIRQGVKTLSLYTRRNLFMTTNENILEHGHFIVPDQKWYKERLSYTADINVKLSIPAREYESKDFSIHTFPVMLNNITNLMSDPDKKIYIDAFNKVRNIKPTYPTFNFNEINGKFPFAKYLLYRSCITDMGAANTLNMIHNLTNYKYECIIMDHDRQYAVLPKRNAKMLLKLFSGLTIIYTNSLNEDENFKDSSYRPGIYETKLSCRELKLPDDLARKSLLVPKYKGDEKGCQMFAVILAKLFNDVVMTNFGGYSVTMHAAMDSYCYERTDFSHHEIQLAKKNGFDMKEQLSKGEFTYLSGHVKYVPYSALALSGVLIDGKKYENNSLKMTKYSIQQISEKNNYLNSIVRSFQVFKNKYVDEDYGCDNCMDCAIQSQILEQYAKAYNVNNDAITGFIKYVLKIIHGSSLYRESHGYLYKGTDEELLKGFNNEYLSRQSLRTVKRNN